MEEKKSKEKTKKSKKLDLKKIDKKWFIVAGLFVIAVILLIIIAKQDTSPKQEMFDFIYSISLDDGTILDSGTVSVKPGKLSDDLKFKTDKLDQELSGIAVGEEKTIILNPEDAYGEYDSNKVFYEDRVQEEDRITEINRTQWIQKSVFVQSFNEQPIEGEEYPIEGIPWNYKVLEVNDTHVKLSQEAEAGQEIPSGFFTYVVTSVTSSKIKLRIDGEDTVIPSPNGNLEITFTTDKIITTLTPELGQEIELEHSGRVIAINETTITLDQNHEFAGQILTLTVKLDKKYYVKAEQNTNTNTNNQNNFNIPPSGGSGSCG